MKRPRPSVIDKIKAKQAAADAPPFTLDDVQNLTFAARRALGELGAKELLHVSASIARAEAVLGAARAAQEAAAAQAAAKPAEAQAPAAAPGPHLVPDAATAAPEAAQAAAAKG